MSEENYSYHITPVSAARYDKDELGKSVTVVIGDTISSAERYAEKNISGNWLAITTEEIFDIPRDLPLLTAIFIDGVDDEVSNEELEHLARIDYLAYPDLTVSIAEEINREIDDVRGTPFPDDEEEEDTEQVSVEEELIHDFLMGLSCAVAKGEVEPPTTEELKGAIELAEIIGKAFDKASV